MKVAGSRDANLKDNRTGKEINGVFLLVDYLDESVTRMIAEKIFVSAYMLAECGYASGVGDSIQLAYNKYGKRKFLGRVDKGRLLRPHHHLDRSLYKACHASAAGALFE